MSDSFHVAEYLQCFNPKQRNTAFGTASTSWRGEIVWSGNTSVLDELYVGPNKRRGIYGTDVTDKQIALLNDDMITVTVNLPDTVEHLEIANIPTFDSKTYGVFQQS